jgi:hypothetical protein
MLFVLMCLLARTISRMGGATRRVSAPWLCGYAVEHEMHRYRAGHLFDALKDCLRSRPQRAPVPPQTPGTPPQPSTPITPWSLEKN